MKISIASDHNGFILKGKIIDHLTKSGYSINDLGTNSEESCDYPDYANLVCEQILEGFSGKGILICGTGIGMSISANRMSGIRAALCFTEIMSERSRMHNDANILVLGSKIVGIKTALKMVDKFLNQDFEGGRHSSRLRKIR